MADPVVGKNLPPVKEMVTLELCHLGKLCIDGVCYRICAVQKAYLDAEGNWVRGFHNPLDATRSFSLSGCDREKGQWLTSIWWHMAMISGAAD